MIHLKERACTAVSPSHTDRLVASTLRLVLEGTHRSKLLLNILSQDLQNRLSDPAIFQGLKCNGFVTLSSNTASNLSL